MSRAAQGYSEPLGASGSMRLARLPISVSLTALRRGARSSRAQMPRLRIDRQTFLVPLAALLLSVGCGPKGVRPDQPVTLGYGGAAGESRRWALEQVFRGEVAFGMVPQLVVVRITGSLDETVLESLPDGRRKIRQRWSFNPPELNGMKMGEAGPTKSEVTLYRDPAGTMSSGDAAAPQADLIAWAARVLGGVFPLLPDRPMAAGVWWDRSETLHPGEGIDVIATQRGRFTGFASGRVAKLETEGAISLAKPVPGGKLEEFRVEYGGEARLDLERGWLDRSEHSGTVNVKGRSGKAPIIARLRFTGTLTPVP